MAALAAAIQFLLITPPIVRRGFTRTELGRSTAFFPLVGALLGTFLAAFEALLTPVFSTEIRSALVMVMWIGLTGGLHFDGLLDTVDGLLGGGTPERRLQIMRDEHTGAYAVAAAGLILLTMFSALNAIPEPRWDALLIAPALGRCGLTVCIAAFPYARPEGLGRDIKDHTRPIDAGIALFTTVALVLLVGGLTNALTAAAALLSALIVGYLASVVILKRIPGMTGDTYGAINMLIEATVLLTFAAAL